MCAAHNDASQSREDALSLPCFFFFFFLEIVLSASIIILFEVDSFSSQMRL